jgi:hypothetical protein
MPNLCPPLLNYVVHGELLRILSNLETKEMLRFRRLREKILEVSTGSLKKSLKETNRMVDTLIKLELSWINTNHPDFVGVNVLSQVGNNRSGGGSDDGPRVTARPSQARRDEEEHHDSGFFSSILFGSNKTKSTSSTPAARLETRPSNSGNRWSEPPATIRIDDTNITDREKVQIDLISTVDVSQICLNALPLMSQYPPSRICVGLLFQDCEEEPSRQRCQVHNDVFGKLYQGQPSEGACRLALP